MSNFILKNSISGSPAVPCGRTDGQTWLRQQSLFGIFGLSHSQWPNEQFSFITTMRLPILQLSCCPPHPKASHHPGLPTPLQPRIVSLRLLAFPKATIAVEKDEICECDCHTVHKLNKRRLTADWLAPRESDCSRTHSKVSSDCQVTLRPRGRFSGNSKWLDTLLTVLVRTTSKHTDVPRTWSLNIQASSTYNRFLP